MFDLDVVKKNIEYMSENMFEHIFAFSAWLSSPPEHVGPCDRPVGANQPVACVVWAAHLRPIFPSILSPISNVQRNPQVQIQQVEKL